MLASMKHNVSLTIASLLSILFITFHLSDDIVHGMAPGKLTNLNVVLVLAVWLYGALVLAERRSGYVIMLVMSLLASGVPVIHMIGNSGLTAGIARSAGAFFFVWTLYALGVTAVFSVILSARGLLQTMKRTPGAGK
jgi:hypothetical protein